MEPYGEVGVLMNLGGGNTGGEILKSLLTSSKMQKSEPVILRDLDTRTQQEEQIVFQIELGQPIKSEFIPNGENIIQHIPVTYLTSNGSNLTPGNGTLIEPVTYVLSRDIVSDTSRYCTVGSDDPQKVFLVQEIDSNERETFYQERRTYTVKESQTNECTYSWSVNHGENCTLPELKPEENWGKSKEQKKRKKRENSTGRRNEEEERKTKSERNMSTGKNPLAKRKNSKLKGKVKVSGKCFPVKRKMSGRPKEEEKVEGEVENLFELTKLEDNVDQVARRLKIGCECSDSNCFDGLNPGEVFKHRLNIADLTKAEHDMYLMGVIMASIHNLEETCRHKERIRIRSCYAYQGKKVCLTAFLYLQHVTLYQMKRLRSHLKNHGVSPRIHGNRGRKPANTFSLDIYRRATNFVQNYIEEHCIKTPNSCGTTKPEPSNEQKPVIKKENKLNRISYHLPPECTKRIVHREYKSFCESFKPSQKAMKYSTFTNFLKKQFPNVKFHKREEKKGVTVKTEETEKWKKEEKQEEGDRKPKEDQGVVDKSVQVDKGMMYSSEKGQIIVQGHLYDESNGAQPEFGVADEILVGGQSYNISQSQNAEQFYTIDSAV